ncbi:adenosylmethionine decarboxylase [Uliginosibacterium sediminicola]|uniref:S-adenosylmethionine decarboxylase proenzyme n=1 Tax=Uliginosibacterium sediminicola TaxID=2024550 RepID=A0ABU9YYL9_9RHOO
MSSSGAGRHLLLDLNLADSRHLSDVAGIERLLREAASLAGATVIHAHFHHFGPDMGVTGMLLLQESHISIHTWPEHAYAAVDIFMCGDARPELAASHIESGLHGKASSIRVLERQPAAVSV